jgi:putative ABC transport system permease protein
MRWWELFRQAVAGAARARLRSALTAAGIAIGCGALVSMVAFALGLQQRIEEPLKRLGMLNDIYVSPRTDRSRSREQRAADDGRGGDAESKKPSAAPSRHPPLDSAALERFRALPGVKYAYPQMSLHDLKVAHGQSSSRTYAMAFPRDLVAEEAAGALIIAGHWFSLDDASEVLLGEGLLKSLGFDSPAAAIDKIIEISAAGLAETSRPNQFEFQLKTLPARVVGVFQSPDFGGFGRDTFDRSMIVPIDVLEQLPGAINANIGNMRRQGLAALNSYQNAVVRAENPGQVPRISQTIEDQGFRTRTVLRRLDEMHKAFLFIETLLTAVGSVALVIAGLGIANTLLMTVLERYEEIGLYKAIGATDGDVRVMFLAEAVVLGLVGSLAGLALAGMVCWVLQWAIGQYMANQGVDRPGDVFYFPWWLLTGAVAFSTALSILSGLYPASRAARVDPIQALRRA